MINIINIINRINIINAIDVIKIINRLINSKYLSYCYIIFTGVLSAGSML